MLLVLVVESADNANSAEAFAHNSVLLVDIAVGNAPKRLYSSADEHNGYEHYGNEAEHYGGKQHILSEGKENSAEEQYRHGNNACGEHGGYPAQGFGIVGGTGNKRRSAKLAHFAESHGVHLDKNGSAKITAKARSHLGAEFPAHEHGYKPENGDNKHV